MHIVMFTLKSPWSWSSLETIDAERATRAHPDHINEIKGWSCGRNITRRDIAADFVVIGLFENREDLNAYIIHPDHQKASPNGNILRTGRWLILNFPATLH